MGGLRLSDFFVRNPSFLQGSHQLWLILALDAFPIKHRSLNPTQRFRDALPNHGSVNLPDSVLGYHVPEDGFACERHRCEFLVVVWSAEASASKDRK